MTKSVTIEEFDRYFSRKLMLNTCHHSYVKGLLLKHSEVELNLMIGPDQDAKGGIASVVSVLKSEGFLRRHNIIYVASHVDGETANKLLAALSALIYVFQSCLLNRPCIVHAHVSSDASFFRKSIVLLIARIFGRKTIFHLHGAAFQKFATDKSGLLAQAWIRHTLKHSTQVIALSDSWASFLATFAPDAKIAVVPNAVKTFPLAMCSNGEAGRILFLGRAEKRKGIYELLTAISQLKNSIADIKLAIGGDGDLDAIRMRVLELNIEENVEILGWLGPEQKMQELARASVFALPSFDEGLPMAMLEAMSVGKAVVVTPVGGIPEAVTDGVDGFIVPPGDVDGLVGALKTLLRDTQLRELLGNNARKTIETKFSSEAMIGRLERLYNEIALTEGNSNH